MLLPWRLEPWGLGHGMCPEQLCPESYPGVRPVRLNPRGCVVRRRKTTLKVGTSTSTALTMVHQVGPGRESQSAAGASVFIELVVRFHVLPARLLLDHGSMPLRRLCKGGSLHDFLDRRERIRSAARVTGFAELLGIDFSIGAAVALGRSLLCASSAHLEMLESL